MSSVGIVGGGMLGMTLALRLRQQGHEVTLIEAAPATGGLASAQSLGGYTWDRFYHVILLSDSNLRGLLDELGLAPLLHWGVTRTGFYTDGTLYSLSDAIDFAKFPPLSPLDKVRLAVTVLYAAHLKQWRRLEAIPVAEWLGRLSGRRTLERIWLPLLKSKLGENYRIASAAFIWAIIARLYAARRTGLKREMFGYVEGGYDTILARFREALEQRGVEMLCATPAKQVMDASDGATISFTDGSSRSFDHVVLTIPCGKIAALCPQLGDGERERLHAVVYQGITCASMLLRKPLASYYVTNITDSWVPFTAVVEMTTLVDRARFGGHALVYLPRYMTQDDAYWQRSDDSIRDEWLGALERMYPAFTRDDVVAFRIARARDVLAVSTLHYSERALPPVHTSLPHLFVVNSAQIASGTLNVNETVGLANEKAAELAPALRTTPHAVAT